MQKEGNVKWIKMKWKKCQQSNYCDNVLHIQMQSLKETAFLLMSERAINKWEFSGEQYDG